MTKTYKYRISATVTKPDGIHRDVTLHAADQFEIAAAAFHGISVEEAERMWILCSMRLPAEERREAEQLGFPMGFQAAELYANLLRDSDAQERDTETVRPDASA